MAQITPFRLRALLAALESTEGQDESPTPGTHAILLINGEGRIETEQLEREIDYPYFTGRPFVRTNQRAMISGDIELLGAETVGDDPPIDAILQAAGHAKTVIEDNGSPVAVEYNPIAQDIPSLTAYWYHGGERMRALGCRIGIERIRAEINNYCTASIEIQGNPEEIDEQDLPEDLDYSAFQEPVAVSTESLTVELDDKKLDAISVDHELSPDLTQVEHSEGRATYLSDRGSSGTLRIYRPAKEHIDIRKLVEDHERVPLLVTIAGGEGRSVELEMPGIQMQDPQRTEVDGLVAWDIPYVAVADEGNDDYLIRFK